MDKALLDYEVSIDADCKLLTVGKPFAIEGINHSWFPFAKDALFAKLASHRCQKQRVIHCPMVSFLTHKHSATKFVDNKDLFSINSTKFYAQDC